MIGGMLSLKSSNSFIRIPILTLLQPPKVVNFSLLLNEEKCNLLYIFYLSTPKVG